MSTDTPQDRDSFLNKLLRRQLLAGRIHEPLDEERKMVARKLRFIPVAKGLSPDTDISEYLRQFKLLEEHYTKWRQLIEVASASNDQRGEDGLNDGIRNAVQMFSQQGGFSAVHTPEQMKFALKHGILVMIAMEVESVRVTVGAVLMLSRTTDSRRENPSDREIQQRALFSQFDRISLPLPENAGPDPEKTAATVRSVIIPTLREGIELGLVPEDVVPNELLDKDLRRLGGPAAAKALAVEMMLELKKNHCALTEALLSNVALIAFSKLFPEGYGNDLGRLFNEWMTTAGYREKGIPLDTASGLELYLRTLISGLQNAQKSLLGKRDEMALKHVGIVSGKGLNINKIVQQAISIAGDMQRAIESGQHAEW